MTLRRTIARAALAAAALAAGCATPPAAPQAVPQAGACTIVVHFRGIVPAQAPGTVRVAVWGDAADFMRDGRWVAAQSLRATEADAPLTFRGLKPGRYAVSAFHDVTDCGAFRRSIIGIPMDPWAVSGGNSPLLPPSWTKAVFEAHPGVNDITLEFVSSQAAGKKP
jgi:uncharacterized protein (DUF2141 family)